MKNLPVNHEGGAGGSSHSVKVKPIRPKRRFGPFVLLFRAVSIVLVLCLVGAGVLYFMLSRGAISNAHLKSEIESQLSTALGPRLEVKTSDAKIAFGKNGLIALDVSDLRILQDNKTNLGVVNNVTVAVKALPLFSGEVVAQSLNLSGASLALEPYIGSLNRENTDWPKTFDFSIVFQSISRSLNTLAQALDDAGLEKIHLSNTKLIGFEQLGMGASHAQIAQLVLERRAGEKSQIVFDLSLEIGSSVWTASGAWQNGQSEGRVFSMVIDGISLKDFPAIVLEDNKRLEMENSLRVKLSAPFENDGKPKQATLNVEVMDGETTFNNELVGRLISAELNFRYFPEKNQIEMESSPVQLQASSFELLGGVKFPLKNVLGEAEQKPVFQLIANDLIPFGLIDDQPKSIGAAEVSGWIDAEKKALRATSVQLKTKNGDVTGTGALLFNESKPAFNADLKSEKISISTLKNFWPWFLAPDFRKWADKNLSAGKLINSSFKLNFPPGLLGNRERYTEDTFSGDINVTGATVKTVGALPLLTNAVAKVRVAGTRTSISLKSGKLNLEKNGTVRVTGGIMKIGSYAKPKIDTSLNVSIAGKARAIVQLGTLKPLGYSKALNLQPHQCTGEIIANVETKFGLKQVAKHGLDSWTATVDINDGALKAPLFGRKVDKVDVKIQASEGSAKVVGTANIDGLPATLALVEKFGDSEASTREISLTLDDAARKRLGVDTGDLIKGPVKVVVKAMPDGSQQISADLRPAKLNLSWVSWSKGAGIPAKASFIVTSKKGLSIIRDLRVEGKGFSASGKLEIDKAGMRSAAFKKIKLNKTDDFDVDVSRIKNGHSIKFKARSYDGRALIQSFLQKGRKPASGSTTTLLEGRISQLIGFGNQTLNDVQLKLDQRGGQVRKLLVTGVAEGNAPTSFSLTPVSGGSKIKISTANGGSMLRLLDVYTKARGGTITASLVRDKSQVYTGIVVAKSVTVLGEPRLAALLAQPRAPKDLSNRTEIVQAIKEIKTDKAKIDQLLADIKLGNGSFNISRGRLTGGDASAEFSGKVYDKKNNMKIRGTYLPARTLNRMVSRIPVLGWALGRGKVSGLLGITFKLSGPYRNPALRVNPLSIITPGVFRKIFR